jgi:nucleoid DNA-binding protein
MKKYFFKHGIPSKKVAERIVDSLFSSIEEMIRKHEITSMQDFGSRNLAIDPTSPMDDPKFILFDP